jgi:hypothetical protein
LEEELLDLARLKKIGLGFSELRQEKSFKDLTFIRVSEFKREFVPAPRA